MNTSCCTIPTALLSDVFEMNALNFILTNIFQVGLIAIIIVFQPELRSALEKVGGSSLSKINKRFVSQNISEINKVIDEICKSCESLSASKTGALIVIERDTKIGDVINSGTVIDAEISSFLLNNIFFNKAPLHDGAVIVRNFRIFAAGCLLPLSSNEDIIKDLGTRHRAAIGMSENSDAAVIVVSEETGTVSVALDGKLKRGFNRKSLNGYLKKLLINSQEQKSGGVKDMFFKTKKNNSVSDENNSETSEGGNGKQE